MYIFFRDKNDFTDCVVELPKISPEGNRNHETVNLF